MTSHRCTDELEQLVDLDQLKCRECGSLFINVGTRVSPTQSILLECIRLMARKSSDYDHPTRHQDGLDNFRTAEELGLPAWLGALNRLQDKNQRIKSLTFKMVTRDEGPAVVDETIEDTFQDAVNYNAICLALYREWVAAGQPFAWRKTSTSTKNDDPPSEAEKLKSDIEKWSRYHKFVEGRQGISGTLCSSEAPGYGTHCGKYREDPVHSPNRCSWCQHLSHRPGECGNANHGHPCPCTQGVKS